MNYADYRTYRSELLEQRRLIRLDCMNPAQALASRINPGQTKARASEQDAVDAWSNATSIRLDPKRMIVGKGVREILCAIFTAALNCDDELWLPEDVYPAYWESAVKVGHRPRGFATLSLPDIWTCVEAAGARATILLPIPLSPLGRSLTDKETDLLLNWLGESRERRLIIDGVYTYDFGASRNLIELFSAEYSDQCFFLWSCSKSWLSRGVLGLARVPSDLAPRLQRHVSHPSDLAGITALIECNPDLPKTQQDAFGREWARLGAVIRPACQEWKRPATGYFSVVHRPFSNLLNEHGILAVPASVFGASGDDSSIVTCLHDLAAHEREV